MTIQIVTVNVTQTVAPAPSKLQGTGCFISQGATTLAAGETQLLTQLSDLSSILTGSVAISSMVWSAGTVTVTTAAPHGIPTSDVVLGVIAGVTPSAYSGTFSCTSTGASTFTYPLVSNPGSAVITGSSVFTLEDVQELVAMVTTFFAQGSGTAIYVLELGTGTVADGVASLTIYLADPSIQMYLYGAPNTWASSSAFKTLADNYSSTNSEVYFMVNCTSSLNVTNALTWTGIKSAVVFVQDESAPVTEYDAAAMMYQILSSNPSTVNKVGPFSYRIAFGVSAFTGTNTVKQQLKTASINYIGTGAEGGISNKIIFWGTTADSRNFLYWYSVDWNNINIHLDLANEIINGSNNSINPLYFNQPGINRLQMRAQGTVNRGITYGLTLSPANVDAVPFITYVTDNPSDYPLGIYNGLSLTMIPATGFVSITFNMNVSDFITG